jgi:DNA-binding XRE family transcriptional regulator
VQLDARRRVDLYATRRSSGARWETRFARRVLTYGVSRLAADLQVDRTSVYQWIRGSVAPRPEKAMSIVMIVGDLNLRDIYQHRTTIARVTR